MNHKTYKNIKIFFVIIFICTIQFCFISNVFSKTITITECEYTDSYKKWLTLTDDEKKDLIEPQKCKNDDLFYKIDKSLPNIGSASTTDSKFNAADHGYITSTKNQGHDETCWAFATIGNVETSILKESIGNNTASSLDFSEAHLAVAASKTANVLPYKSNDIREYNGPGSPVLHSSPYFTNRLGPVSEASFPYSWMDEIGSHTRTINKSDITSKIANYTVNQHMYNSDDSGACSAKATQTMKNYLIQHGSMIGAIYYATKNINNSKYYYNPSKDVPNHAILIIGWDDTIPAESFKSSSGNVPSRNGAWIIKNSYGLPYYEYISYDDILICAMNYGYYDIDTDVEDNVYVHDTVGSTDMYKSHIDMIFANKFTKKTNKTEKLKKVSAFNVLVGQKYDILYSSNGNLSNLTKIYTGTTDHAGDFTIDINNIEIPKTTDKFAIAIKFYKMGEDNVYAIYSPSSGDALQGSRGLSYYSADGKNYNDLLVSSTYGIAPIRAYTDTVDTATTSTYTATLSHDNGIESTSLNAVNCQTTNSTCEITLPSVTPKSGYTFLGWYTKLTGGAKVGDAGSKYAIGSNVTLYAISTPTVGNEQPVQTTKYSISFMKDSSSIGVASINTPIMTCETTETTCKIILPEITAVAGYEVDGWYDAQSGGQKIGVPGSEITINKNMVLYARANKIVQTNNTNDPAITNNMKIKVRTNPVNTINRGSTQVINTPNTASTTSVITYAVGIIIIAASIYMLLARNNKLPFLKK